VLTFALDGKQTVSQPERVMPKLAQMPKQFASADVVAQGQELYHQTCFGCHGAGAVAGSWYPPDLRYSGYLHSGDAWRAVVIDGVLASRGMVSFKSDYSDEQSEAIRAYVISRTQQTLKVETDTHSAGTGQ
jgi:mono/diheme cytochrome c family protein